MLYTMGPACRPGSEQAALNSPWPIRLLTSGHALLLPNLETHGLRLDFTALWPCSRSWAKGLCPPGQIQHHTVGEPYSAAQRHGGDELAFRFSEDLMHLVRWQNQGVA